MKWFLLQVRGLHALCRVLLCSSRFIPPDEDPTITGGLQYEWWTTTDDLASQNAPWLPWTGAACNTLKFTFVHLTYCPSRQQLPDATNPLKGIMTLRHMCSTGALHMVGSNEQHVQGCSSVRQTDVHCFTEWVGGLFVCCIFQSRRRYRHLCYP